jgi:hypothetical protein
MSTEYPAATLVSARQIIRNGIDEILHLTRGDLPQAFGMARQYCLDMAEACHLVEIEMAHFAASTREPTANTEDAAMNAMENAVHPVFAQILAPFAPKQEAL